MNIINKAVLSALALGALAPAQAALQARDMDANPATIEAYYDTELNLTWLADAKYARTSGFDADGLMTYAETQSWIASLNAGAGLYGRTDWRLPVSKPVDGGSTFNVNFSTNASTDVSYAAVGVGWKTPTGGTASELGNLYANSLGLQGFCEPTSLTSCIRHGGWQSIATNFAPFTNLTLRGSAPDIYWTGSMFTIDTAGVFNMHYGAQVNEAIASSSYSAWAVIPGDVAAVAPPPVPEPETYALMLLGLGAVLVAARRKAGR